MVTEQVSSVRDLLTDRRSAWVRLNEGPWVGLEKPQEINRLEKTG
jgi:hypothetical protein